MKKWKLFFVAFLMAISVSFPAAAAQKDDITGHYYEHDMRTLISKGIIAGNGNGVYAPNGNVTRAEFAAFIDRILGLTEANSTKSSKVIFSDVSLGKWYTDSIHAAVQTGIVSGYPNGTFKPNNKITRQEMASLVDRALQFKGISAEKAPLTFNDSRQINPVFYDSIQRLLSLKVISGDGSFGPEVKATRGETAAVLNRMMQIIEAPPKEEQPSKETPSKEEPIKPEPSKPDTSKDEPDKPESSKPELPKEEALSSDYQLAVIRENGNLENSNLFKTFEEARNNASDNHVMMKGKDIVWMKTGVAATNKFTIIYDSPALKGEGRTYVNAGTELKFLDATEKAVKVELAGAVSYVSQSNVKLIPPALSKGRSHYKASGGDLIHYIYNPISNTTVSTGVIGKAPAFMAEGQKYYSWDGISFTNESGQEVGEAYQYFTFLPLHSKSNYTAEELDNYLLNQYPDTLKKQYPTSPLFGTGAVFKEMEEMYHVNALYFIAHAIHESAWGTSKIAQDKKNLFGMGASDGNAYEKAYTYASFEDSIKEVAEYVSKAYHNPTSKYSNTVWGKTNLNYYNGAITGNKAVGMNVRYASDPYWGEKIAGYMYRADQYLGSKDHNQLALAVVNTENLKVRSGAGTGNLELYTYNVVGIPMILHEEVHAEGATWYKISLDSNPNEHGFVYGNGSLGQYVKKIPLAN